jgi:hypothetical protein
MRINKKLAVAASVASIVALGAGTAVAYWTTTGSGTGTDTAHAGDTAAIAVSDNFAGLAAMYPGDSVQILKVKATNNATEVTYKVQGIKAYITTDANAACDGSNFKLNGSPAPSTAESAVALTWTAVELAKGASAEVNQTIQFNNTADNQDACKGAKVTIHYAAS